MAEDNPKIDRVGVACGIATGSLMLLYLGFAYQAVTRMNDSKIQSPVEKTQPHDKPLQQNAVMVLKAPAAPQTKQANKLVK